MEFVLGGILSFIARRPSIVFLCCVKHNSSLFFAVTPGVGIGIVDLGYERRLANQLGAHRAPSIIGLVNGRVTFFHQAVVREHLRQFIEDLLPHKLVEKVNVLTNMNFVSQLTIIEVTGLIMTH